MARTQVAARSTRNSLKKGPKGGQAVTANMPATKSAAETRRHGAMPLTSSLVRAPAARRMLPALGKRPLGQAVAPDVEQRRPHARGAERRADDQDAHVLDAGIREHALEVPRASRNSAATSIENSPMARSVRPAIAPSPAASDHRPHPQDRGKCHRGDAARQERADDAGRFAVGVGLPGVHRGQPHLRPVADEQQTHAIRTHGRDKRRALGRERGKGEVPGPPPRSEA